jgi:pimeloyl-ACP methyl ester carboxylesterase
VFARKPAKMVVMPRSALALIGVLAVVLFGAPSSAAAANPCPTQRHHPWMGDWVAETVTIPSLGRPSGISSYTGTVVRPADQAAYPGARPVVLIQHGLGGSQCAQWWTARDLAGHGYVAVVWTSPVGGSPTTAFVNAADAMRSARAFVRTPANPYAAFSDTTRIALAGHSLGSIVASVVQQDGDPGVRAIVALDTLRRSVLGDPGGAVFECPPPPVGEITPRVPALGFAKDEPCDVLPNHAPADLKLAGFNRWREAGVPAVELVMAGYNHLDFATPGSETEHRDLAYFIEGWLARWLSDDPAGEERLFADAVRGRPIEDLLSTTFRSGAYLPGRVDSSDFRAFLADHVAPETKREHGPRRHVSLARARRGIKFRWSADDAGAIFQCRLDSRDWRSCEPPKRIGNPGVGRHRFRVRATDPRGNVEPAPAVWRFRVER